MSGRRVHFMGVGGVGMAGLAVLLKARGNDVSGCDLHASARTRWLEAAGIPVAIGHSPDHLTDVDELIVTPAVPADAPEFRAAKAGCTVRSRGDVLAELVGACDSVAVCGSHGKTTTATWIAKLLLALGEDVSWCIGGETGDFPVAGVSASPTSVLVVEADESDGTLAHYRARTLVVNKCDYDHPDHFPTAADYFACYDAARRQAVDVIESEALGSVAEAEGEGWWRELPLHNRKNARAAIEVALRRGHARADILAALAPIVRTLPDRRFQTVWPPSSTPLPHPSPLTPHSPFTVITDYAHHPTEMACAVEMARKICSGRLRVLFQPHRYSRTKALLASFPSAFAAADEVVLCPTYAAFERPLEGGDVADLYAACRAQFAAVPGPTLFLARSCAEAWEHARRSMSGGDLTLLLGAGDIIRLVPQVREDLANPDRPRTPRRIWIGGGTNTWKSDLNLDVAYVRTDGPAGRPGAAWLSDPQVGPLIPWMAGIPGTLGGWVKMNAGAFGHSISEAIESVLVDDRWISAADCGFGYRQSAITGEIRDVHFRTATGMRGGPTAEDFLARRRKFPAGTWGSVFKNPPDDFAGRLLEAAGAKDLRVGGASVWSEHANVIVAGPTVPASDTLALARLMQSRVFHRFGVCLEPEVCGLSSTSTPSHHVR